MKIDNQFTVGVPVDHAWAVLTDLEDIAPCMPGAQLTGVDGEVYSGRVKVRVGPVVAEYTGTARFVERDETGHRAVISASGRDSRAAGTASAEIVAQLRPDGAGTVVTVDTDLRISGRIAQLGRGMIKEVSTKLLTQFSECLEAKLATTTTTGGAGAERPAPGETPVAAATAGPEPTLTEPVPVEADAERHPDAAAAGAPPQHAGGAASGPETSAAGPNAAGVEPGASAAAPGAEAPADDSDALDLMRVAGPSIVRRIVPLVLVVVVAVGLIVYFVAR